MTELEDKHGQALGMAVRTVLIHLLQKLIAVEALEKSDVAGLLAGAHSELKGLKTGAGNSAAKIVDTISKGALK